MGVIEVQATIDGLDALAQRIERATRQIAADAAGLVQAASMKEAPVGVAGNSTNTPGDLRRSIIATPPVGGGPHWTAFVGPTVIYGRQRELGGEIFPKVASLLAFTKFGTRVLTTRVSQGPNPYMARGEVAALPAIRTRAVARVARAIAGSQ